jgi:hypothetical protein
LLYVVSVRMQSSLRVNNIRTFSALNVTCPSHHFSRGRRVGCRNDWRAILRLIGMSQPAIVPPPLITCCCRLRHKVVRIRQHHALNMCWCWFSPVRSTMPVEQEGRMTKRQSFSSQRSIPTVEMECQLT